MSFLAGFFPNGSFRGKRPAQCFAFSTGSRSILCRRKRLRRIIGLGAAEKRRLTFICASWATRWWRETFRSPRCRGEIDLIGWDDDVLCFVEVKTRTTRDVKPGEAAVDRHKRRLVAAVVRDYLRRFPPSCQWRFDVVSVYYLESRASQPQIEVFRNSSLTA